MIKRTVAALASLTLLSACGGGGGNTTPPVAPAPPQPPVSSGPTWTPGVFEPEGSFKNLCAAPRSGIDPATNAAYPDQAGSITEENFWLRSWSNRTYLWYSEITDQNPANFGTAQSYFDVLKTNATTASGNPRDRFHFYRNTAEYQQQVSSGSSSGYGARFRLLASSPPRDVRVAYTQQTGPARDANLTRGAKILTIDGVDVVNGSDTDTLNAGLFPSTAGESHTFVVQDLGSNTTREITLTSATVTSSPVLINTTFDKSNGEKVGYTLFNTFGTSIAEEGLFNAMTDLAAQGVTDMILDLRYNGGGFLAISSELGYMLAGPNATNGRVYETLAFNDKHPNTNPITGNAITPAPFYSTARGFSVSSGTALPTLNLPKVYILSTSSTCSASESLINGLLGIDVEVVLIGSTSCGKPYGFYATDNCGTTYFTIQFRGENDKGFGDYADGFSPQQATETVVGEAVKGCTVPDDFNSPLGVTGEAMISAAMTHIETGACPASSPKSQKFVADYDAEADPKLDLLNDPRVQQIMALRNARILNGPEQQ